MKAISGDAAFDSSSASVNVDNMNIMPLSPHADYPGLEYPPIFEPETYSLADPQSSLSLLRKQAKNNQ